MLTLTITRHGETEENIEGIFQGQLPGKLSDLGIKQAIKLAQRLKEERFDHIYSSDLGRAVDTTKEIVKFHPSVPVDYTKCLREMDLGELEGTQKNELCHFMKDPEAFKDGMPGGETFADFEKRASNFLQFLKDNHDDRSVLIVCHENIARALISLITRKNLDEMNSMGNLTNASISKFEIEPNGSFRIILYNCHQHLL